MNSPVEFAERKPLPEGRRSNIDALAQLEEATGIATGTLQQEIPELSRTDLSFGLRWASEGYNDSEIGRANAEAVKDFLLVSIPELNVAGDTKNDMEGINRSYHINVSTSEIKGSPDYYGAEEDLSEKHATHTEETG